MAETKKSVFKGFSEKVVRFFEVAKDVDGPDDTIGTKEHVVAVLCKVEEKT